jgi:hypothetical protein
LDAQYTGESVWADESRLARREEDRSTAPLREHTRDGVPRRMQQRQQVHRQQPFDLLVARLGQLFWQRDAGVAEQDVDGAKPFDAPVDGALRLGALRDVSAQEERGAPRGGDLALERPSRNLLVVSENESRPLAREAEGACPADARARPRDQSGFAGETHQRQARACCRDSPSPWIPRAMTSPSWMKRGGVWPIATPAGVPVEMMSPGLSVMNWLT